jgi:quercetin dioxygenase-like cupin family protein
MPKRHDSTRNEVLGGFDKEKYLLTDRQHNQRTIQTRNSREYMDTNITQNFAGKAAAVIGGRRSIGGATATPWDTDRRAPSIKYQPRSKRYYFDVSIGSICLSGEDTGGKYCLLDVSLAPKMGVPLHTHTREDETYYVISGELEVTVGERVFVLREGDTLIAPRDIPHQLRNSGNVENHYLLAFSPSGFEGFVQETAIPAPDNAVAPTKPPAIAVRNVHELASAYGILFG